MDLLTLAVILMGITLYVIVWIDQYFQNKAKNSRTITQTQQIVSEYVETKTREMPIYHDIEQN